MIRRSNILFAAVAALMVVTIAGASVEVTILGDSQSVVASSAHIGSHLFEVANSSAALIEIGKELSQPPADFTITNSVKPLPAVPATVFMVLAGFLCVSLVRDRRVWLKVVTGALKFGVAGVNIVPQLIEAAVNIKVGQLCNDKGDVRQVHDFSRCEAETPEARYIGLLRRMAIPDGESLAENFKGGVLPAHCVSFVGRFVLFINSSLSHLHSYICAIIKCQNPQVWLAYSIAGLNCDTNCDVKAFYCFLGKRRTL